MSTVPHVVTVVSIRVHVEPGTKGAVEVMTGSGYLLLIDEPRSPYFPGQGVGRCDGTPLKVEAVRKREERDSDDNGRHNCACAQSH